MRWRELSWSGAAVALAACIANAPEGIQRQTDVGGNGGETFQTTDTNPTSSSTTSSNSDPHAVIGVAPPHGPFSGGGHVVVHGNGFTPDVRVWFGDTEADGVIAIDPTRVQVSAPAHQPGQVDVSAQNGDDASTRRSLVAGYTYDALYAQPDEGPVAGGTVITIVGVGSSWLSDLGEARVDQKPCTTLQALSDTELSCTVPKGTPGTKSISVTTSQGTSTALDAYTYQDSSDGFKGGLSGAPLAGSLKVLVYDNFSGTPIPGAHVIAGTDLATGLYQQTDSSGLVLMTDPMLDQPTTVTVAAACHSPISFVDVPVDSVTVYLDPILTPLCAGDGDPPPGGGNPVQYGAIAGELVWPSSAEFKKGTWDNIPAPLSGEERVAYVFFSTTNRKQKFSTPAAQYTVREDSPGDLGYGFQVSYPPGNRTMYSIAGIRDLGTGQFTAYAMGYVKGVAIFPNVQTGSVVIPMDHALDQALVLDVSPPPSGPKGPDRLDARVVVEFGQRSYGILPAMQKTPLLPLPGAVSFVGLPPLDEDLTGARYVASAEAVTGPSLSAPTSVVRAFATTTTSLPVAVGGFVSVPVLVTPAVNGGWDGRHLAVDYPAGGFPADLTVYEITAGGGLVHWLVAVPQASHSITLPDLTGFEDAHLPAGPLVVGIYGAHIEDFDYGTLGYAELRPSGMDAYGLDYFNIHL